MKGEIVVVIDGKKNSGGLNVWILFATATLLLAAGWLMKPFPVLIFAALAPLFAISDQAREHPSPWNRFELILLALSIGLLAAHAFDLSTLIPVLLQAILFTFVFVGYAFAYKNLGARLGKFTIIFFWLGLEYLVLKLPWHTKVVYLADSILLKPDWYTDYPYRVFRCNVMDTGCQFAFLFRIIPVFWF